MLEQQRRNLLSPVRNDLDFLQQRASHQHNRFRQSHQLLNRVYRPVISTTRAALDNITRLPSRYVLHIVIILVVPLALLFSPMLRTRPAFEPVMPSTPLDSTLTGIGPINIPEQRDAGGMRIGDPPLLDVDALPMPLSLTSRSEALAPVMVPATISGEGVKLRDGPGLEYDDVATITDGTSVQVIGRHGDWFRVREHAGATVYWVAGEWLSLPEAAIYTLFEVPESEIPPPPPPRVGTVREHNLNLRDGPGTNYVSMARLEAGQEFSLVEQYQGWMHIANNDFNGWVSTEFLEIGDGIMHRVPTAETIPDPNPPLVGFVNQNQVNARKGPGTAYEKVSTLNAESKVDLLARHKDWYRVQLADGTRAWVYQELLNVTPMAHRRVPITNDIPALPAPPRSVIHGASSQYSGSTVDQGGGNSTAFSPAPPVRASGDVAGLAAQFVGYRYTYGGSSPGSGFDCSGLVAYVYRQYGIHLPHNAAAQYSTAYGAMIGGMQNLAPGDLMFFANTGGGRGITHVSIYLGGGRMVHAMMPGLGVQVSSIWENYWTSHYVGAIRPYR